MFKISFAKFIFLLHFVSEFDLDFKLLLLSVEKVDDEPKILFLHRESNPGRLGEIASNASQQRSAKINVVLDSHWSIATCVGELLGQVSDGGTPRKVGC